MAKFLKTHKWKKYTAAGLSIALSAVLSLGVLSACGETKKPDEEEEETTTAKTDTQLIRNGDFEFYDEMTKELKDKRSLINTPNSWSFTSGSPSSDTASGLVNVAKEEYDQLTASTFSLISEEGTAAADAISYAVANWDKASVYDRLQFYSEYEDEIDDLDSKSEAAELFDDYNYSIDFEDVENVRKELGENVLLHDDAKQREDGKTGILMIHNDRESSNVLGTGQYYTSSTTITLQAGTAAKVSVWVKTSNLYHRYASAPVEVTKGAGAYIGVTNTVGGTTLDQMQIKNINTKDVTENNGWEQYTVYVRANTFATSTFRIVLGLGQGSTSDVFEHVNGYALFDDLECTIIPAAEYETATATFSGDQECTYDSKKNEKLFDATTSDKRTFALDLYAGDNDGALTLTDTTFGLTEQVDGSNTYTSAKIDASLGDNRSDLVAGSVTKLTNLSELKAEANNGYLKSIYKNDFENKFPFGGDNPDSVPVVMLLSSNGAAYTAKMPAITLDANSRMLISFYVKTSEIISGRSGASITLVDGENKTQIAAFDSTTVDTIDIENNNTEQFNQEDVTKGWVQCFFFVTNDTDNARQFHLELSFGPTTIVGTQKSAYGQGYAAFTNFETRALTKKLASYATTGDRAINVSLTGVVEDSTYFDTASASGVNLEDGLASPSRFDPVAGGSSLIIAGGTENKLPEGVYSGLLNAQYADTYKSLDNAWANALDKIAGEGSDWWNDIFGAADGRVARQPLVIMNTGESAAASYGYLYRNGESVAANTYQRIHLRVKASAGTTAYIYLIDESNTEDVGARLTPNMPKVTYWYDDEGNICSMDPSDKEFDSKTDVLYTLEENGLYRKEGANDNVYYANLWNYETKDGNLVTSDDTIAFYGKDGKYYAYYNEETEEYSQEVVCLPKTEGDKTITRYDFTAYYDNTATMPESMIAVQGTGEWVDVDFYIHTGSEAKDYRLEVWAGERTNSTDGIPAGGYVFFDNYTSATASNYEATRDEAVNAIKDTLNAGKQPGEEGYLTAKDNLPKEYALYYTFTFYDSVDYLRYDVNEDEDNAGNPYAGYTQSTYSEQIVYLLHNDAAGTLTGTPTATVYLDYGATDVTVEASADTDDTPDTPDTTQPSEINIWLVLSSVLLAAVIVFAIVALIVRRVWRKRGKKVRVKKAKAKRVKAEKSEEVVPEVKEEKPLDENDPYNE